MKLIPDWKNAHKFFSVQVSIFWGIVSGAYVALPAFQGMLSPVGFGLLCVVMSVALVLARLTNQPGA